MPLQSLQTRFILAGCLLVMTTVGSGLWSGLTFARLSAVVGDTLRESQETIDETTALASSLEREDDALLLALTGDADRARRELLVEREHGDASYARLVEILRTGSPAERSMAQTLGQEMEDYRKAGAAMIGGAGRPEALETYHKRVNPLLRQAVNSCGRIREENFVSMQQAGVRARDEANAATWIVAGVVVGTLFLATGVAVWLARSVVGPVLALTASVEAVRQGDFERRVSLSSGDELGQLATGFNRMAETLGEYRRSSLGELLAAKTTLEATLNALPDAVFVLAPDSTLAALNVPALAILEACQVGQAQRLRDLPLKPEHRAALDEALAGRACVPSRTNFGLTLDVAVNGQPHRFLLTAVPIPEFEPHGTGAVVVLDDVTEFARLDELRSELIGVASHELKTPLTTLHMNLLLLSERADNLNPRQSEMLTAARQGCEELGSAIDELLDVTRIEAGQLRLDFAPVDIAMLIGQVLRGLQPRFEDAHIRCEIVREQEPTGVGRANGVPPTPAWVWGDAARLRTVLTNLLTNALKYSPAGSSVTVRIGSEQQAGADPHTVLQVAVTDAGPGVPVAFRERVFEKFFRVEHHLGSDQNGVRGTGIGLYLCREIIKAHGGRIGCEANETGRGACFRFTLPRVRTQEQPRG
jgi:two-component system, NtrC family, sensor histidine kinase KinB